MAKGFTEAIMEEIKARIDLVELISSYGVSVKTAGSSKKACCPFHHEKTPSFNINESKGYYHCFGCGESGDAIKFVQKMDGLTFVEAVKKLADQTGVKLEEQEDPAAGRRKRLYALLAELAQFYHRCLLQTKEGELARKYLQERALDQQIQSDYLIGYAPNGVVNIRKWGEKHRYTAEELEAAGVIKGPTHADDIGYHRFGGRLMFSIRDKRGRVVGFSGRQLVVSKNSGKYVNSPETLVFKKSNVLYGFDKAAAAITKAKNREAIVCEGQIDCIRLQTSGFLNAVAGQGTAFTEEHVKMLKKAADQVALVYDDDGAGHKATVKSARLCLAAGLPVRVVSLPNGDDPDSYLRTHPAEDFQLLLDGAESIIAFQVRAERLKERNPDSIDAMNRITREILYTIASCSSAILRASMTSEAAKFLNLPEVALREELAKTKVERAVVDEHDGGRADDDDAASPPEDATSPIPGEDAATIVPPPAKELAFCEFLMANEYAEEAKTLDGMIGEFLPRFVFEHEFTWAFVEVWRTEVAADRDFIAPWSEKLLPSQRNWFDQLLLGQTKTQISSFKPTDILEDFIRALWIECLKRVRGKLTASGDGNATMQRMKITIDLKRFNNLKWHSVKDLIRDWSAILKK